MAVSIQQHKTWIESKSTTSPLKRCDQHIADYKPLNNWTFGESVTKRYYNFWHIRTHIQIQFSTKPFGQKQQKVSIGGKVCMSWEQTTSIYQRSCFIPKCFIIFPGIACASWSSMTGAFIDLVVFCHEILIWPRSIITTSIIHPALKKTLFE